jgi:hypothetical protein
MAKEVALLGSVHFISQTRAALVLLAGLVALLGSAPMPGPGSRRVLQEPETRAELEEWVALLAAVGVRTDADALGEAVYRVGQAARDGRAATLGQLDPVIRLTGTRQGWGLFAYPRDEPFRLVIEHRTAEGDFTVVYRSLDHHRRWLGGWLHLRRIRAMYAPGRRVAPTYDAFVAEVARRSFVAAPDVVEVRVGFEQIRVRPPPGPIRSDGRARFRRTRARSTAGP